MLTLYVEGVGNAIRASGGTLSYVEFDSICALFGHEGDANAAQGALRAAGAIEGVIADLNNRLGQRRDSKVKIAVSIHAGRAAIGEIGSSEPPMLMAIGEASRRRERLAQGRGRARQGVRDFGKSVCRCRPCSCPSGQHNDRPGSRG